MLKLKKVAVTGGIASGKSTVCRFFEEMGAYVVSADKIVHQLLKPSTNLGAEIVLLLGDDIVEGEELNREVIAQKVFRDPSLLEQLEKRVHPQVQKVIEAQYQEVSHKHFPLFVAEVPLLYESGQDADYDLVILVIADEKSCRERFHRQTCSHEEEFNRRTERLLPMEEKQKRASILIRNDGSLETLRKQIETIFKSLKEPL